MHGAGNDYVYLDCFEEPAPDDLPQLAAQISDRHFGVGSDGLVAIRPHTSADAEMRMYNADGSEAEMCGNALRCVAWFLRRYARVDHDAPVVHTGSGPLKCEVIESDDTTGLVRVEMGKPESETRSTPQAAAAEGLVASHFSMGNPHCVLFVPCANAAPVESLGPAIENDRSYPNRTNVGFAEISSRTQIRLRVWERGTGETLACGTGACAAAAAAIQSGQCDERVSVALPGGELQIEWPNRTGPVYLTGPVAEVFRGEWLRGG